MEFREREGGQCPGLRVHCIVIEMGSLLSSGRQGVVAGQLSSEVGGHVTRQIPRDTMNCEWKCARTCGFIFVYMQIIAGLFCLDIQG